MKVTLAVLRRDNNTEPGQNAAKNAEIAQIAECLFGNFVVHPYERFGVFGRVVFRAAAR